MSNGSETISPSPPSTLTISKIDQSKVPAVKSGNDQ
jgi:hypothetical protein